MPQATRLLSCADSLCAVCNLQADLLADGAESVDWRHLSENNCELFVVADAVNRCAFGLKLDPDNANYRRIKKGEQTRMCDFAVGGVAAAVARLIAIELKEGAGYADQIEQLVQGLRVLHRYFPDQGFSPRPEAVFVVGREADKLAFSLRDQLESLRFGEVHVRLRILSSGDVLEL
ncbi:hypothetical protein [Candidatus Poriferisodalis sp.]|uniref:hypothetical protein n=1 Tax=Candidatus Poriferisodalis sp. TaxID=3101277 RepID=UPI003AF67580